MAPQSIITVYLPGILNLMQLNRLPSAPLFAAAIKDPAVDLVHKGFKRLYHMVHPASSSLKIAFTACSAFRAFQLLQSGSISDGASHLSLSLRFLTRLRFYAAMMFGIYFLLRKSEFLFKPGKIAPPLRSCCIFLDAAKNIIPHHLIGVTKARWLVFHVGQSKTDQHGNGRVNTHEAQPEGCIVSIMEEYFRITYLLGALPAHNLFDVPGLPTLTSASISRVMKDTVSSLGLPASRVTTHSLRYGGATMLASGGYPEYIIAMYGGWAEGSVSLRRYTRPSLELVNNVSRHMQSMRLINIEDDLLALTIAKALQV